MVAGAYPSDSAPELPRDPPERAVGAGLPPGPDPAFVHATLARLVRRRFWLDVARLVPMTIAVGVVWAAAAPAIEANLLSGYPGGAVAVVVAGLALAGLWSTDDWRPERFGQSI